MKALVTGGAGFIGSNLVNMLLAKGYDVTVLDNESATSNEKFYWNNNCKNVIADVASYQDTRRLYDGVDHVFHLAAEARIPQCIEDPLKAVRSNTVGTGVVLQCSREAGVKRVMYSSTSSVYGLKNAPPLREDMPTDCLNPYSVTKLGGEELCKMYSSLFGLQTVIFRYFNVYGNNQPTKGQYAPVVGIFQRQRVAGEHLTIVGDGEQRRDFVNVMDVVSANMMAATYSIPKGFEWGQVYNIGSGIDYSVNEVASMVGGPTVNIPPRIGEANTTLADITKAKNHLGWTPEISLPDWIKSHT
jgi:UDP-glucose 4-epimerase